MPSTTRVRSGGWRSRWAAVGAAVAVTLGAGGLVAVNAAPSALSSFVSITPTRILDTRTDVGLDGPFVSDVSQTLQVTGMVATQPPGEAAPIDVEVVPSTATSVVLNVTVVRPSTKGFLSIRPGNATGFPATSNINWAAGGANIANSATVQLPASGDVNIFVNGTVGHVLVDVAGYNVPAISGPAGPAGADGSNGPVAGSSCVAGGNAGTVQTYFDATTGALAVRCSRPGYVFTLAGTAGISGSTDGPGAVANFNSPYGVAVDTAGNVYVADLSNYTIRKISPDGVAITLAGTPGSSGSNNGPSATARFNSPRGVAVDTAGNVYVADSNNYTIRKISPAGAVTTLAGTALSSGSTDGTGAAARFNFPSGVAVDTAGNVYVADTSNQTIRKISPAGVVTTLAGTALSSGSTDGTGAAARFSLPFGVAVDTAGNVYVADYLNQTIRKISPAGVVTTLAGDVGSSGWADGTGAAARFSFPPGVAVDTAGNVYVADTSNHAIRKIN